MPLVLHAMITVVMANLGTAAAHIQDEHCDQGHSDVQSQKCSAMALLQVQTQSAKGQVQTEESFSHENEALVEDAAGDELTLLAIAERELNLKGTRRWAHPVNTPRHKTPNFRTHQHARSQYTRRPWYCKPWKRMEKESIRMQSKLKSKFGADDKERQIQPIQDIVLSTVDAAEKKPLRVAVFAQAAYLHLLPSLQQCITNVGAAQANTSSTVDVYLSTPTAADDQLQFIEEGVKRATPGLGLLEVQKTQNKGADMGQLLQQMQSASEHDYDAILKIHTKGNNKIRQSILNLLCGSVDTAQKIIASFAANPALGLAGVNGWMSWRGEPSGSNDAQGKIWAPWEQKNMKRTWSIISPDTPMPPEEAWTCTIGSFWWSRGSSVTSNPLLLAAADELLAHMQLGYSPHTSCLPEHAMERLVGTMVRADGAVIARITH